MSRQTGGKCFPVLANGALRYVDDHASRLVRYCPLRVCEVSMKGEVRERWEQLCEQAANEQDPLYLDELVTEINQLLSEKEERLRQANQSR